MTSQETTRYLRYTLAGQTSYGLLEGATIQQLDADHPVTELWQVITGAAAGRTSDRQITLFDSVGFAIEDFSALRYVRDRLQDTGLFHALDLLADPDDPRDLFGMLQRATPAPRTD